MTTSIPRHPTLQDGLIRRRATRGKSGCSWVEAWGQAPAVKTSRARLCATAAYAYGAWSVSFEERTSSTEGADGFIPPASQGSHGNLGDIDVDRSWAGAALRVEAEPTHHPYHADPRLCGSQRVPGRSHPVLCELGN